MEGKLTFDFFVKGIEKKDIKFNLKFKSKFK